MRKRYNPYPWLRKLRFITEQCIIPITVVQAIRTILFPTTIDVILLAIFILLSFALHYDWI
ncbi:hypothetical protein [Anoxybacillus kestanbolensis]|uniref:hypothetical protein n=1 Tax=Anoxybacillus kestanbolensis TaxID=227476 RepID=UPI003D24D383